MAPGGAILVMALFTVSFRMTTQLVIHVSTDNDAFMRHLRNGKESFHILRSIADFLALLLLAQGIEPNPGPLSDGSAEKKDLSKKRQPNTDPGNQRIEVPAEEDPTQTSDTSVGTTHAAAGSAAIKSTSIATRTESHTVENDQKEHLQTCADHLEVQTLQASEQDGSISDTTSRSASSIHDASSQAATDDDDNVASDWDDDLAGLSISVHMAYPGIDKDDLEAIFGRGSRQPSQGPSMDDDFRVNSSTDSELSIDDDKDTVAGGRDVEHAGNSLHTCSTTEIDAELKSFSSVHNTCSENMEGDDDNIVSDLNEDNSGCSEHPTGPTVSVFLTNLGDEEIDALFGCAASNSVLVDAPNVAGGRNKDKIGDTHVENTGESSTGHGKSIPNTSSRSSTPVHIAFSETADGDDVNADSDWDEDTPGCVAPSTVSAVPVFLTNLNDEEIDAMFGRGSSTGSMQCPSMDDDFSVDYSSDMQSTDNRHEKAACTDDVNVDNKPPGTDYDAHETYSSYDHSASSRSIGGDNDSIFSDWDEDSIHSSTRIHMVDSDKLSESQISYDSQDCPPYDGRDNATDNNQSVEDDFYGDDEFMTDDDSIESLPFDDNDDVFDDNDDIFEDDNGVDGMCKNDVKKKSVTFATENIVIYFDDNEISTSEYSWTISLSSDDNFGGEAFLSDDDSVENLPFDDDVRNEDDLTVHQNEQDITLLAQESYTSMSDMKSSEQSEVAMESVSFKADISITESYDLNQDNSIGEQPAARVDMPTSESQSDNMSSQAIKNIARFADHDTVFYFDDNHMSDSSYDDQTNGKDMILSAVVSAENLLLDGDDHVGEAYRRDVDTLSSMDLLETIPLAKAPGEPSLKYSDQFKSTNEPAVSRMDMSPHTQPLEEEPTPSKLDMNCVMPGTTSPGHSASSFEMTNVECTDSVLDKNLISHSELDNTMQTVLSTDAGKQTTEVEPKLDNIVPSSPDGSNDILKDRNMDHNSPSTSTVCNPVLPLGSRNIETYLSTKESPQTHIENRLESTSLSRDIEFANSDLQNSESLTDSSLSHDNISSQDILVYADSSAVSPVQIQDPVLSSVEDQNIGSPVASLCVQNEYQPDMPLELSDIKVTFSPSFENEPLDIPMDVCGAIKLSNLPRYNQMDTVNDEKVLLPLNVCTSETRATPLNINNISTSKSYLDLPSNKPLASTVDINDHLSPTNNPEVNRTVLDDTHLLKSKSLKPSNSKIKDLSKSMESNVGAVIEASDVEIVNSKQPNNRKRKWHSLKKQKLKKAEEKFQDDTTEKSLSLPSVCEDNKFSTVNYKQTASHGDIQSNEKPNRKRTWQSMKKGKKGGFKKDMTNKSDERLLLVSSSEDEGKMAIHDSSRKCSFRASDSITANNKTVELIEEMSGLSVFYQSTLSSVEVYVERCLGKNVKKGNDTIDPYSDIKPEYMTLFTLHQSKCGGKQIQTKDGKRYQQQKDSQTIENKSENKHTVQTTESKDKRSKLRSFFRRIFK